MILWYNLANLDISGLTLDMIPDYTSEMEERRMELYNLSLVWDEKFTKELREEYATLEFTRGADFFRDQVLADGKIDENEKEDVTRALQLLARKNRIKAGLESY